MVGVVVAQHMRRVGWSGRVGCSLAHALGWSVQLRRPHHCCTAQRHRAATQDELVGTVEVVEARLLVEVQQTNEVFLHALLGDVSHVMSFLSQKPFFQSCRNDLCHGRYESSAMQNSLMHIPVQSVLR